MFVVLDGVSWWWDFGYLFCGVGKDCLILFILKVGRVGVYVIEIVWLICLWVKGVRMGCGNWIYWLGVLC